MRIAELIPQPNDPIMEMFDRHADYSRLDELDLGSAWDSVKGVIQTKTADGSTVGDKMKNLKFALSMTNPIGLALNLATNTGPWATAVRSKFSAAADKIFGANTEQVVDNLSNQTPQQIEQSLRAALGKAGVDKTSMDQTVPQLVKGAKADDASAKTVAGLIAAGQKRPDELKKLFIQIAQKAQQAKSGQAQPGQPSHTPATPANATA